MLQNATPLRKSAPGPLTALMNMSLVLHLPKNASLQILLPHACHRFWKCYKNPPALLTFDKVRNPLRLPRETTSERPKGLRTCNVVLLSV